MCCPRCSLYPDTRLRSAAAAVPRRPVHLRSGWIRRRRGGTVCRPERRVRAAPLRCAGRYRHHLHVSDRPTDAGLLARQPPAVTRYPYVTLGEGNWTDYTVGVDVLLTQAGTSAGVIGRFSDRAGASVGIGRLRGYIFDVSTTGACV
jgi:hypothetical protein